jgi:hypothetical protein
MPRKAKNVPGTERYRDQRRTGGGPRMHSRKWHDHDEPRDIEPLSESVGNEALPRAESAADRSGMGRRVDDHEKRKRMTPPSKGVSRKTGAGKNVKSGQKGSGRI